MPHSSGVLVLPPPRVAGLGSARWRSRSARGSRPHQAQDEQDQEDDKEDIEQDAGHIRAGGGQTSEAKERRDHMMSAHFSNDMGRILSQE